MSLTNEQQKIVYCESKLIAVNAYAGTGKTHTLVSYSERHSDDQILYLAYNTSMRKEAQGRFDNSHVDCHTVHSLAFEYEGKKYRDKILYSGDYRVAELFSYFRNKHSSLNLTMENISLMYNTLKSWFNSISPTIEDYVLDLKEDENSTSAIKKISNDELSTLIQNINTLWFDMRDVNNKELKMVHDGYLKLFQLGDYPITKYSRVLLDEAQDSNAVTVDIFLNKIEAQYKIMVGDVYQAIYQFRGGNLNALSDFQEISESIYLTNSFRFGKNIADLASITLNTFRREENSLSGLGKHNGNIQFIESVSEFLKTNPYFDEPIVLISRGNGVLFSTAFDYLDRNLVPKFSGGIERYELDLIRALTEIHEQKKIITTKYSKKYSSLLGQFDSLRKIQEYARKVNEIDLLTFCILVDQYGSEKVSLYLDEIIDLEKDQDIKHDIELVTAHRSKGLEYNNVVIADDFTQLSAFVNSINNNQKPDLNHVNYQSETNLIYVAITRTKENLFIRKSSLFEFITANDSRKIPEKYFGKIQTTYIPIRNKEKISESDHSTTINNINNQNSLASENKTTQSNIQNDYFINLAIAGELDAQLFVAKRYFEGTSEVPQDYDKAFFWYQKAAKLYSGEAQCQLGNMYCDGQSVTQNYAKAIEWYTKAAEHGLAAAQFSLGNMYEEGRGVTQDDKKAFEWYLQAAAQGDADSQSKIGWMYHKGTGVLQDDDEAREWSLKAANQGFAVAQNRIGYMYENGIGVSKSDQRACEWYLKAANQGDSYAQFNLGVMYEEGRGVTQDDKKASTWFNKAASQGIAIAQFNLGVMYEEGRGVTQDDKKASTWFKKAASQGHLDARYRLEWMCQEGRVGQHDISF